VIYLVGSGPGDPGLFTVKGVRCMREADAVVYDRLAPEALLGYARPDAEKIYVGKKPGNPTMSQDEINTLLVELGQDGCPPQRWRPLHLRPRRGRGTHPA